MTGLQSGREPGSLRIFLQVLILLSSPSSSLSLLLLNAGAGVTNSANLLHHRMQQFGRER